MEEVEMKVQTWAKVSRWSWLIPVVLGLLLSQGNIWGQDPGRQEEPAVKKEAKERTKPRGRLPAYYSEVVSPEQKEKIYDIQQKYFEQIQQLQEQMKELEQQREAEVTAVLTLEQKERVAQLMAAKKKRKPAEPSPGANGSSE